jgi:hypothetical protein
MQKMPNLTTKRHDFTAYGLACGYVQVNRKANRSLMQRHGVYFVTDRGPTDCEPITTQSFRSLSLARKALSAKTKS